MIQPRIQLLRAPYPVNTSYRQVFWTSLLITLFVMVFLLVFQPFGLARIEGPQRWLQIASFALPSLPVVVGICLLCVFAIRRWNFESRWTVMHEMGLNLLIAVSVGSANFLYLQLLFDWPFSWELIAKVQIHTAAISFFPIAGMVLWDYFRWLRQNQGIARNLDASRTASQGNPPQPVLTETPPPKAPDRVSLYGASPQENLSFPLATLRMAKAEGNYVEIHLSGSEGKGQHHLLRATLSGIEMQLQPWASTHILRCHRSYLVNLKAVLHIEGNAQGLLLHLEGLKESVPVSRRYVPLLKTALGKN
jgi:hypothetical protein